MSEQDPRKRSKGWRRVVWALLLLALCAGLGFAVASGDVNIAEGFELQKSLSNVRQTLDEGFRKAAPVLSEDSEKKALRQQVSDLETRIALGEELDDEPLLRGADVRVEVAGGTATLTGSVGTAAQKETAERIARSLAGNVSSRLHVSDSAGGPGTQLARRVEFELFATEAFDLATIQVTAEGGVVTLRGQVRSLAERLLAARVAAEAPGVSDVVDELAVSLLDERRPGG